MAGLLSVHATESSPLLNEAASCADASDTESSAAAALQAGGSEESHRCASAGRLPRCSSPGPCACLPRLARGRWVSMGLFVFAFVIIVVTAVLLRRQAVAGELRARKWAYSQYTECLKSEAKDAGITHAEMQAALLPWDTMPNLLASKYSRYKVGEECDVPYNQLPPANQPYYCPCERDLSAWTQQWTWQTNERFEDSRTQGIRMRRAKQEKRAAQKLLLYAFALVLPLALTLQLCYRTLFGTEDSPSMIVVLCTNPKRFHRWLQEDLRRVAAITVMGVPAVLFIVTIVELCSGWRWVDKGKRMAIIAVVVTVPCAWVSYVLCSHCPSLFFEQGWKLMGSAEDASKPSVTVEEGGSAGGVWVVRVSGVPVVELQQRAPNPPAAADVE